jgi:16S rRNA (uracil1498-N3)-methyltransferase
MNLILFEPGEIAQPLPVADPRAQHLRAVLRRKDGEPFDCGVVDGPRGRGSITHEDPTGLHLAFTWGDAPPPPDPVWLVVGLPRPQTARKILGEIAALGVTGICFFRTEKGEASYASSQLWTSGESRRLLLAGTAQAFCTRVPRCVLADGLAAALASVGRTPTQLALDNYEAAAPLTRIELPGPPAVLVIGPERGCSAAERATLRAAGFTLVHVGTRVLRTETACVAGLALLKARLGFL